MSKVNPIYANPKVQGSPVKILEIRTDKDNPQGYFWVQYSDNTYGPVRIPKDYYLEDKSDELRDETATQQAIIDNVYKGMSDEQIAQSQSDAEQALYDYRLTHTDEETEQYRQDLERQAIYNILHPTSPAEQLQEGLGTALSLGIKDIERGAAEKFQNASSIGDYTEAGFEALSPFLFNNAYLGNGLRLLYGGYHLADENGVRKTWRELKQGNYGNAALSATGDLLNAGLAVAGGSGMYDMGLDIAAKLGNTNAKAIRFARALNKDIASTDARDIVRGLAGYGRFDTRGYEVNIPRVTQKGQPRMFSDGTYPIYNGPRHSVSEVVNPDGTVNVRKALEIEKEVSDYFKNSRELGQPKGRGAFSMRQRIENPEWHTDDPNTLLHTKGVTQSAYELPVPEGYTKQDQVFAALAHDSGKIISGDGHENIGAALIEQIFPDATVEQLQAIRQHMYEVPDTPLGKYTKAADIINGRSISFLNEPEQYPWLYNYIQNPKGTQLQELRGINGKIEPYSINESNAKLISDEIWDKAYFDALASRDLEEAQRLRDLHFLAKSGTVLRQEGRPITFYHQTSDIFNTFKVGQRYARASRFDYQTPYGIFTKGSDVQVPLRGTIQMPLYGKANNIMSFYDRNQIDRYLKANVPDYRNYKELLQRVLHDESYGDIEQRRQIARNIAREIKPIVDNHFRKVSDAVALTKDYSKAKDATIDDVVVFLDPTQVKSQKFLTRDDFGNIIPLSKRDNFTIEDTRYFGIPQSRVHPSLQSIENPLQVRLARLRSKPLETYDPSTQAILTKPIIRDNDIRKTLKALAPDLTEDQLDMGVQRIFASKRGVHLPIGNDAGETISGVSIVDIQDAVNFLRKSGIKNPTATDVGIIAGHEAGHGVRVSEQALNLVKDYYAPEEFYTQAGQILDVFGIKNTSTPVTYNKFMNLLDTYLKNHNLDNGISNLRNYMQKLSPLNRQKVMANINRFSAGLFGAYLIKTAKDKEII